MNDIGNDTFNDSNACKCRVNVCDFGAIGKVVSTPRLLISGCCEPATNENLYYPNF